MDGVTALEAELVRTLKVNEVCSLVPENTLPVLLYTKVKEIFLGCLR